MAQWLAQNPYVFLVGFVLTIIGAIPALWQLGRAIVRIARAIWAKGFVRAYRGWVASIKQEAELYANLPHGELKSNIKFLTNIITYMCSTILFMPCGIIIITIENKIPSNEYYLLFSGVSLFIVGSLHFLAFCFLVLENSLRNRFILDKMRSGLLE